MIERIVQLLTGAEFKSSADRPDELQVAVAALLVEAARVNDRFDASKRQVIERLLASHFGLSLDASVALLTAAEDAVRRSTQLFRFTEIVVRRLAPQDRAKIVEILWQVVYADGRLDPEEDAFLRRIGALIGVADAERVQARRHVLRHVGQIEPA